MAGGNVVIDIINTSQNDNILLDTPDAKNVIQYEPNRKTDYMKQRKAA
jgi:hypothetical protein